MRRRGRRSISAVATPRQRAKVERERDAAKLAGLPVELTDDIGAGIENAGALRLDGQAAFHARKYLLGLARLAEAAGATIHEDTRVAGVDRDGEGCVLDTEHGELPARRAVLATHVPSPDLGLFGAR